MPYSYWRNLPRRFETAQQQHELRRKRINAARLLASGQEAADLLANCSPDERCGIAACPICMTRFRMAVLPQLAVLLKPLGPKFMVTIVLEEWLMIPLEFQHLDVSRVPASRRARVIEGFHIYDRLDLARSLAHLDRVFRQVLPTGGYAFGMIEVVQRDRKALDRQDRLSVHAHLVTAGIDEGTLGAIKAAVERRRIADGEIPIERPVNIDSFRNLPKQLSYCVKSVDYRSCQYFLPDGSVGSRSLPMSSILRGEHVKFMAGYSITDLVFSRGIRLHRGSLALSVTSRSAYLSQSGLRAVPSIDADVALEGAEEWLEGEGEVGNTREGDR
jgi:hypothetical protein